MTIEEAFELRAKREAEMVAGFEAEIKRLNDIIQNRYTSYGELKAAIETAPKTYIPALLCVLVESAYKRGEIFTPGGAANLALESERRAKVKIESHQ